MISNMNKEYHIAEGVTAFSTTRKGGVSQGNYSEFNINDYCGDIETAREKQNFAQEVINVICHYRGNIVGGKRIMKLMGFDLGPNRTPFRNMTDEEEQAMKKELEAIHFFERCNQF